MGSFRSLGVSFYNGAMQLAELEHGKKISIVALGEFPLSLNFEQDGAGLTSADASLPATVKELRAAIKEIKASPDMISFALPASTVFAGIMPIDAGLSKQDLQTHLQWELAQYFPDAGAKEFIIDSHALPSPSPVAKESFVAGVHRGTAMYVQKLASELKLKMHLVDIDQFASEKTLVTNYPEILAHDIVLFGLRGTSIDASVIHEGQMTDYRAYQENDPKRAIRNYLAYLMERYHSTPAGLLLHGVGVTPELVKTLRGETGIKQTVSLNAFRKIPANDKLTKTFGKENAPFCAAIGLAFRAT